MPIQYLVCLWKWFLACVLRHLVNSLILLWNALDWITEKVLGQRQHLIFLFGWRDVGICSRQVICLTITREKDRCLWVDMHVDLKQGGQHMCSWLYWMQTLGRLTKHLRVLNFSGKRLEVSVWSGFAPIWILLSWLMVQLITIWIQVTVLSLSFSDKLEGCVLCGMWEKNEAIMIYRHKKFVQGLRVMMSYV